MGCESTLAVSPPAMRRSPWRALMFLAMLGSLAGVVAGFGSVRQHRSVGGDNDGWVLLAEVLDGRHLTILLIVPLVCALSYLLGGHHANSLIVVRSGSRRAAALAMWPAAVTQAILLWAAVMLGFLSQVVGMPAVPRSPHVGIVLGSLAAQLVSISALALVVSTTRIWNRWLARTLVWLTPAILLGSLTINSESLPLLRPYSYLRHELWTESLWAIPALAFVAGLLTILGPAHRRRAITAVLLTVTCAALGVLATSGVVGSDGQSALLATYDVARGDALLNPRVFILIVISVLPAATLVVQLEGLLPRMAHVLRVREVRWGGLLCRHAAQLWMITFLAWTVVVLAQVSWLHAAGLTLTASIVWPSIQFVLLGSVQSLLYGLVGWFVRSRSHGPPSALIAMVGLAATTPLVALHPAWPAGHGTTVTLGGWGSTAIQVVWLILLACVALTVMGRRLGSLT